MPSTDDDDAFDDIVRRNDLSDVPIKALLWSVARPLALTFLYILSAVARLALAIYGLVVWHNLMATAVVAIVYAPYWAWRIIPMARSFAKTGLRPAINPTPEEREEGQQLMDKLENSPRRLRKTDWLPMLSIFGQCILAGIGVAGILNAPVGIIAAIVLFGVAVLLRVKSGDLLSAMTRPSRLMRPGTPKDTPET